MVLDVGALWSRNVVADSSTDSKHPSLQELSLGWHATQINSPTALVSIMLNKRHA